MATSSKDVVIRLGIEELPGSQAALSRLTTQFKTLDASIEAFRQRNQAAFSKNMAYLSKVQESVRGRGGMQWGGGALDWGHLTQVRGPLEDTRESASGLGRALEQIRQISFVSLAEQIKNAAFYMWDWARAATKTGEGIAGIKERYDLNARDASQLSFIGKMGNLGEEAIPKAMFNMGKVLRSPEGQLLFRKYGVDTSGSQRDVFDRIMRIASEQKDPSKREAMLQALTGRSGFGLAGLAPDYARFADMAKNEAYSEAGLAAAKQLGEEERLKAFRTDRDFAETYAKTMGDSLAAQNRAMDKKRGGYERAANAMEMVGAYFPLEGDHNRLANTLLPTLRTASVRSQTRGLMDDAMAVTANAMVNGQQDAINDYRLAGQQ